MGECYNSTVVDAPIDKVWETIKNFHDMSWCSNVITSCEKVGDKQGLEPGAQRILNKAFHESLISIDAGQYSFSYRIDDGPVPVSKDTVSNYIGVVKLFAVTDTSQTFVLWTSSFESENVSSVVEFCNPIYAAILGALKEYL